MRFSLEKKLSLFAVVITLMLFGMAGTAWAQNSQTAKKAIEDSRARFVKEVQEGEANSNRTETFSGAYQAFQDRMIVDIFGCPDTQPCDGESSSLPTLGVLQTSGQMISLAYQPPASMDWYVQDVAQNMGLVDKAYAQGLGFASLQPLLELWKVFRNIAYVFFVIIFLIIGFAIMFRQSLGGQAAVTIQQALPRIIVALLVVTFSYAIAGLMIDIMYLVMYFIIAVFSGSGLLNADFIMTDGSKFILNENIFTIYIEFMIGGGIVKDSGEVVQGVVSNFLSGAIPDGLNDVASGIVGGLGMLIIGIALVFAMFRTFFSLIKIYMEILLAIVFAPLILMLGAINGNAFGNWLKSLFVNLMVFPALLVFMLVGMMLLNGSNSTDGQSVSDKLSGSGFVPPFIPGGSQTETVGLIAGLATIMLLPEVAGLMAKYKPSSIWDDLGSKAINNIMTGNQLAAPLTFGATAGLYNTARGAYSGGAQNRTLGGVLSGALFGQQVGNDTYGGAFRGFRGGFRTGRTVARTIDKIKSGEYFDPSITASQLDQVVQRLDENKAKSGGGDTSKTTKPSGGTGTGFKA